MKRISIKSKKHLKFYPAYEGFVRMEIDLIQNHPTEKCYELRIVERCFILENASQEPEWQHLEMVEQLVGHPLSRNTSISYEEVEAILEKINQPNPMIISTKNINKAFQIGLLLKTQQECQEGKGRHFSQADDWEIEEE